VRSFIIFLVYYVQTNKIMEDEIIVTGEVIKANRILVEVLVGGVCMEDVEWM
jgi:hypothetical protein